MGKIGKIAEREGGKGTHLYTGRYMVVVMAYFHCRTRIQIRTLTRNPNPMAT